MKTLEAYQQDGLAWCKEKEKEGTGGGFLCDEMGLGKTIQMCALIDSEPSHSPTLVICMVNNCKHWVDELRSYSGIDAFDPPRKFGGPLPRNTRVVIVPYSIFHRNEPTWIWKTKWRRIIMDEGHIASNPKTTLFKSIEKIDAQLRWILSATPMQNKQHELISMATKLLKLPVNSVEEIIAKFYLRRTQEVQSNTLPTLNAIIQLIDFKYPEEREVYDLIQDHYKRCIDNASNLRALKARIMEGIIRLRQASINAGILFDSIKKNKKTRGRKGTKRANECDNIATSEDECENNSESPDVQEVPEQVDCDVEWSKFEEELLKDSADLNESTTIKEYREGLKSMKGVPIQDLESLINGIDCVPATSDLRSTKIEWLVDDIKSIKEEEKVVVFFTFVQEMKLVQKCLEDAGISSIMYEGSMSRTEKEKAVNMFNLSGITVFLMQIKCGGTGLNLQIASRLYITCPNYNPCVDMQAVGRVYRKGQTKEVTAIRMVMKGTVEERCLEISENKLQNIKKTLGDESARIFNGELKRDEALYMLNGL